MDSMDYFHERLEALGQWTEHLQQQTRTVERRLRWWRGFACGMVILGLKSWGLQTSHAVLAAQVEAMQHDIAALQALLWPRIAVSTDQRDPEVVLTEVHRRLVPSANGSSTRTAPATDYWAAGALFADQQFPLLALKAYTMLSAAHSNSPLPAQDRLARCLLQAEPLRILVDSRKPSRCRRSLPLMTRCRLTRARLVAQENP